MGKLSPDARKRTATCARISGTASRTEAVILNTPLDWKDQLHSDFGIYGQDSWTLKRLTVNYGARWEYFAHGIPEEVAPAGRFTGARTFGPVDWPTWTSLSPRGGAVYDLFGNQKTAIKFSMGKFMQAGSTGFSESYNPLALTTAAVDWTDANLDGVPQGELGCVYQTAGCELNLAQLPNGFGVASLSNVDPDIKRMYNIETSLSVQHELQTRPVADSRLVPSRLQEPAASRQRAADVWRLHAVRHLQPDRRQHPSRSTT